MAAIQQRATIAAPPAVVWAFLAEGQNWAEWEPDILQVLSADSTLETGGGWRVRLKPGRMKATIRFLEIDAPRRLVCRTTVSAGMMTADAAFELEPSGSGEETALSYRLQMGGPVGIVLQAINPNKVDKQLKTGLANIVALAGAQRLS